MPRPLTFIRAAETWVLNADGSQLVAAPNSFGTFERLEALGRAEGFSRGDGLPGRAWDQGRPVLMREIDVSYFQRSAAAIDAGVTCAIAVPLFMSGMLKAVIVLFCGHVAGRPSALELWQIDAEASENMTLADGSYDQDSQVFEAASRSGALARDASLPGAAWHRGEVQFVENLPGSPAQFKRAEEAGHAGMQRGLAIPFGTRSEGGYVVAILAGVALPLALAVERWEPDAAKKKLIRSYAYRERQGGRTTASAELPLQSEEPGQNAVAAVFLSGIPTVSDRLDSEPGPIGAVASEVGASALVAIPVVWGGSLVRGVVTLYL